MLFSESVKFINISINFTYIFIDFLEESNFPTVIAFVIYYVTATALFKKRRK